MNTTSRYLGESALGAVRLFEFGIIIVVVVLIASSPALGGGRRRQGRGAVPNRAIALDDDAHAVMHRPRGVKDGVRSRGSCCRCGSHSAGYRAPRLPSQPGVIGQVPNAIEPAFADRRGPADPRTHRAIRAFFASQSPLRTGRAALITDRPPRSQRWHVSVIRHPPACDVSRVPTVGRGWACGHRGLSILVAAGSGVDKDLTVAPFVFVTVLDPRLPNWQLPWVTARRCDVVALLG